MIVVDKTGKPIPTILLTTGVGETNANIVAFNAGRRKFSIDNSIYGHSTVKEALITLQHDKCCFCERKVSAGEPGHIEHYRPKGGYKKDNLSKLVKPGYFWLAYDFDNLFFSCNRCNSSYKKNYFPLADESKRVTNPTGVISSEDPLIICPSIDATNDLIFEQEIIKPKGKSRKGDETINRTGLNRKALADDRMFFLKPLQILANVARSDFGPDSLEAQDLFKELGKKESIFSYMVVCNFPDLV